MTLKYFFTQLYRNITLGKKPFIEKDTYLITAKSQSLRANQHIADSIDDILQNFDRIKIGKTGNPVVRIDQEDYRKAPYEVMYLVLKSKDRKLISYYEELFINEFYDFNDNKSRRSDGYMRTKDGYFYLYVVTGNNN